MTTVNAYIRSCAVSCDGLVDRFYVDLFPVSSTLRIQAVSEEPRNSSHRIKNLCFSTDHIVQRLMAYSVNTGAITMYVELISAVRISLRNDVQDLPNLGHCCGTFVLSAC